MILRSLNLRSLKRKIRLKLQLDFYTFSYRDEVYDNDRISDINESVYLIFVGPPFCDARVAAGMSINQFMDQCDDQLPDWEFFPDYILVYRPNLKQGILYPYNICVSPYSVAVT